MVALKEIKVRGEIRTIVDYAAEMLQSSEFVGNQIHTGWLDHRVATHVRSPASHGMHSLKQGSQHATALLVKKCVRAALKPACSCAAV